MKIAIIGQDVDSKKKIIEKFLQLIGNYGTVKESIHDNEFEVKDDLKLNEEWNEVEVELYQRMSVVTDQMDKYADKTNIVYCGHSLDILAETMALYAMEEVSDEFVEKMIYWNRKLMQKLDLIYWLASPDKILELKDDEEVEYEKYFEHQMEVVYNNIWNDYTTRFEVSEILPRDCPGMAFFESDSPASEMFEIVHDLDNVDDKTARMDDIAKLDRIIKDKKLLEQMKSAMMERTIPLPNGEIMTSGGINL
jgi:hypothetical protein